MILANQPGDQSWPMTAATWILLYKKPQDAAATGRGAEVLRLVLRQGRQDGGGPRLRADARPRSSNDIEKMWSAEIKDAGGKPLFSPTN